MKPFLASFHLAIFVASVGGQSVVGTSGITTAYSSTATISIDVGKADHVFKPNIVQANIGDLIQFNFFPPNHSVVRAEYGYPCIPYELINAGKTGFTSGFHPLDVVLANPPTWTLRINDTLPIFYYCSAPGSCINYGMVGVINPSTNDSLSTQMRLAKDSKYMLQPGETFPPEGIPSVSPSKASTAVSQNSQTASSSTLSSSNIHSSLSAAGIAGISLAAAVVVILAASLCFFVGRNRALKDQLRRSDSVHPGTVDGAVAPGFMQPAGDMVYVPVKAADLQRACSQGRPGSGAFGLHVDRGSLRESRCESGQQQQQQQIRSVSTGTVPEPVELYAPSPQKDSW